MFNRRSLATTMIALLAAGAMPPAIRAEVAAETDAFGNYVRTTILARTSVRQNRIWKVKRQGFGVNPLNPDGDLNGDLWPTIAENPYFHNHPWAVWSRSNGYDYDLAWSRWTRTGWTPIQSLHPRYPGDDLDPAVTFDADGRPYAAWWRNEGGIGRIYVSLFLQTRWMVPFAVSDAGTDSWTPRIFVQAGGVIQVQFQTPTGSQFRIVRFGGPTTITDDLDPIGQFSVFKFAHGGAP